MNIVEQVSKILDLSVEEVVKNSKKIDDNLTYYWNPARGGVSLITDAEGNYLAATSSINFEELLEQFKNGEKNKNLFN